MNINRMTLAGRLTRDVDVRHISTGTVVVNIGCAINRRVKRNGEWTEEPVFFDAQMWGARAEAFARYHQKGSRFCFPDAELVFEQWEAKDGSGKRSKLFVQANAWEVCGSKSAEESRPIGERIREGLADTDLVTLEDTDTPF